MSRKYTIFDDFEALPQFVWQLMWSNTAMDEYICFGQAFSRLP
jgi:mannosyltransferase OCH1-like enzyme